jgi:hypothetical protein
MKIQEAIQKVLEINRQKATAEDGSVNYAELSGMLQAQIECLTWYKSLEEWAKACGA